MHSATMPRQQMGSHRAHNARIKRKGTWFSLLLGFVTCVCGISLLLWNEEKAISFTQSFEEAVKEAISIHPGSKINPDNDGHLVHITGPLEISEPLTEVEYGISVPAVKLKRRVQMYQWVEEHVQSDAPAADNTAAPQFNYVNDWRDKLIDSTKFRVKSGHQNPKVFPFKSTVYVSEQVSVGPFYLSAELKDKFNDFVLITSDERPERRDIRMHLGLYYHTQDVWSPEVGDVRVQFSYAGKAGDVVSIIGKQNGNKIEPYKAPNGNEILILHHGILTVEETLQREHSPNIWLIWLCRIAGWLLLFQGSSYLNGLLRFVFWKPTNGALSLSATLLVVAVAWFQYRPLFSATMAIGATLPLLWSGLRTSP
ncbi:transmembrane protein 43 homolog isoform X1 [Schistocerca piceifrons]|uniref:transmembrane protein 43 homolog isoform X1 n=1 Tax=Schistocerca piceifrons TaxID=274613 RepID=UPI001F5EEADD|nr:transmembrane protein 43 homolog isoform X1 [Schistocerca piceifrons]